MSEFIKIKNDAGDGDMLLKTGFIFRVYDKSGGGANIVYGGKPEEATVFKTASTAAEVLAAIEGAQTVTGIRWHHVAPSRPFGERVHPDAFKAGVAYRETDSGPEQYAVSLGRAQENEAAAKRFVVRGSGKDWRVYDTMSPIDGCNGVFITRERAEEYAESRERETTSLKDPTQPPCTCSDLMRGHDPDCPWHGG